jgi:arylsulfatase A-like enzyme
MDNAVGAAIKALDEEGLTDKTIMIFFSDNGGVHWGVNSAGRELAFR